jgi:hypothetical protein
MATWKKLVISGSDISQLNNDAGYLTSVTAQHAFTTASFNGTALLADSSQGTLNFASGSTGLHIVANAGSDTLTFDLVSVPNSSLENSTISGVSLGGNLASLTDGNGIVDFTYNGSAGATVSVEADGSTIAVGSGGIKVADGQIGTTQIADSLGEIGVNSFTGSFSGSFSGDVDINLADLTAGAGLFGTAYDGNDARIFSVDSGSLAGNGIGTSGGAFVVTPDTTTGGNTKPVTVGANGVGFDISTIDGAGLIVSSEELAVNVDDSTIALGGVGNDFVQVKDGGIGTTQIADSLGTLGSNSFTGSFSGSFTGDGSGLSGLATTLNITDGSNQQVIDLLTETLVFTGTTNEVEVSTVTSDTVKIGLPDDVTIGQDLTVGRNLVVQGTASFQHTTDLQVADRFILMASGSTSTGDGGIVVQQATQNVGELFGFDAGTTRWALDSAFDASQNTFTPDAFMAAVLTGNANSDSSIDALVDARYQAKGNLFIGDDQDIWIYS